MKYDPNFKPTFDYFIVGGKAIIFKGEKFLLLKRSANTGGTWSLPGGALEYSEDAIEGIEREVKEETQLDIKNIKPFVVLTHQKKENSAVIIGYTSEIKAGEIKLNWEHTEYKWVTKEEALKYDLSPDAKRIIEKLD